MRLMVLALALLAGFKVWTYDSAYRSATEEVILSAYRAPAIAACQKAPRPEFYGLAPAGGPVSWASPEAVSLVIGDSAVDVYLWETGHELWDERYKKPYLVLSAAGPSGFLCTYDIGARTARLTRG